LPRSRELRIILLCPHGEGASLAEVADTLGRPCNSASPGEKDIFNDTNRAWVARICREVAANLSELARQQTPLRLTLNGLYELIEKTLVDNNAYFVAKSLLLNRSRKISFAHDGAAQSTLRVIRRNNQVVPWSEQKVGSPSAKAFLSLSATRRPPSEILVHRALLRNSPSFTSGVEDIVGKSSHRPLQGRRAYILYRADRNRPRCR
jgi:ribonucleoside-diphosphate reductase alpha chain